MKLQSMFKNVTTTSNNSRHSKHNVRNASLEFFWQNFVANAMCCAEFCEQSFYLRQPQLIWLAQKWILNQTLKTDDGGLASLLPPCLQSQMDGHCMRGLSATLPVSSNFAINLVTVVMEKGSCINPLCCLKSRRAAVGLRWDA